ncbi:circularly permuted type 2 ATP-grasp protein [Pseudoruegeria sp. HB172150]|uniref:circularly permuted type 2 ATP-grasp protein n=1 Tax=Pseudoruegeria sp. HB172150 TaxID=2721164 RepID=UPI001556E62A|nr:circularly permuted type 2 ATP-grasp protein [Pseudoruegeria sp. HB172150]
MADTARTAEDGLAELLRDYRKIPGVADELLDGEGELRPVWTSFLTELAALSPEELALAQTRGSQYLHDAGVFFRHYGPDDSAEREWPLSHLPLLIDTREWQQIEAGLVERADLLERVMADFYGSGNLVTQGVVPPELLAGNPEWLRPMVGVRPRSGHFLHFLAFDIGRGPDNKWWVLCDRTQAPSGAGFALETRMATARSFAGIMSRSNVTRLARFFRQFRDALLDLRGKDGSRVSILTPGPLNDTYFEHAYIARYLGFLLVQGEDLVVHNGRLMVHTVGGPQPVSVLWRRLDSGWMDPLELEETSQIGTPGLLGALRAGTVDMVNAVGSGALEIRALMAFMPRIAEHLNGNPLSMPNIATWWCGGPAARDYVKANLDRMTVDQAMATGLPFEHGAKVVIGGKTADGADVNPAWIDQEAGTLAAQEIVSLSTAPALEDGRLVARPMSLRVFLARTPDGWQVMPGGFARIGNSDESADIAMQQGGAVSDVWVVSDKPPTAETLLKQQAPDQSRRQMVALPSRAADNLFWLGRYTERAEQKIRMLRGYHLRLAETGRADLPLSEYLAEYLDILGMDAAEPLPDAMLEDVRAAIRSAGRIRDRFSVDGWNALADLQRTMERMAPRLTAGDDAARAMSVYLRKISGFTGLVHENMYRFTGWRFLSLGRAMERAWATANFVTSFTAPDAPEGSYDLAIEAGDSIMTHRRRFVAATGRETVIDLLLLDGMNPRSVLYQLRAIHEHLDTVGPPEHGPRMTPILRHVLRLETDLATATAADFDHDAMIEIANRSAELSGLLAQSYLR